MSKIGAIKQVEGGKPTRSAKIAGLRKRARAAKGVRAKAQIQKQIAGLRASLKARPPRIPTTKRPKPKKAAPRKPTTKRPKPKRAASRKPTTKRPKPKRRAPRTFEEAIGRRV